MNPADASTDTDRLARTLLGSLALVLAIAGQLWLYAAPQGLWPGVALNTLAVLLFARIAAGPAPAWTARLVSRWSISYSAVMIGLAGLLAIMATALDQVWLQLNRVNYVPAYVLWTGSALVYLAAFAGRGLSWEQLRAGWRAHRAEIIGLAVISLLAAGLRFYQLGAVPRVINGDEGTIGQLALATNENPLASPFRLAENFGSLYLHAISAAFHLFGRSPFALRLMPAIGGTLAIPALYLLARHLFGVRVGLTAALMLAVAHTHLHFSRTVAVAYLQGTWLIPLELFFFISGLEKRSPLRLALGGLFLGLHFGIYLSAQIVAAFLVVYLLIAAWLCRPLVQAAGWRVGVFWLGALVAALPQIVYAWRTPEEFFARLNADGTFQSGWLAATVEQTGQSALTVLAGRVAHAFLSLNYYPALDFYGAPVPMLDFVTAALFVLGLGYALWRTRDHRFLLLNGYFWSITVAIGVFSVPPSADSYRMLAALPAAVLLAAVGLDQVLGLLTPDLPERRVLRASLLGFLLAAVLALNLRAYFVDFAQRCRYGLDIQTRFASYLGNYLRTLDRETPVYLLNDSLLFYGSHGSVDFLSGRLPVTNAPEPAASLPDRPGAVIVAVPSRADELLAWAEAHPGGRLNRQQDCGKLMLLAYHSP